MISLEFTAVFRQGLERVLHYVKHCSRMTISSQFLAFIKYEDLYLSSNISHNFSLDNICIFIIHLLK